MKKQVFSILITGILLFSTSWISAQGSLKRIKVDTDESKVTWMGKKPTGEHKGYVKLSEGELIFDETEVKGGSFVIDMSTITDTDIQDEDSRKKLVSHLKSSDFFDIQKFPTSKFVITSVKKQKGAGTGLKTTHRVEGDLTVKGVTKKISFDASINLLNGKFTATTPPFTINRTEWGVNYQSKSIFSGLVDQFIYDDITLTIDLVSE
jgi:polyisoprenoid-binding protein YceI